jgi:hypothetical protein
MSVQETKITKNSDPIWIHDPMILIRRYTEFFPIKSHTREERINALVRMSLYISIVLSIYFSNTKYFLVFIFFIFLSLLTYSPKSCNIESESFVNNPDGPTGTGPTGTGPTGTGPTGTGPTGTGPTGTGPTGTGPTGTGCTSPTMDNPFMNATMKDYLNVDDNGDIINRPPACNTSNPDIKKQIDQQFNNNLYIDVSDLFGKLNSQRNFYTMPSTTIPNDRENFQKWLYNTPQTCKENQDFCNSLNYENLRSNRFIFPEPEQNPITSKKL